MPPKKRRRGRPRPRRGRSSWLTRRKFLLFGLGGATLGGGLISSGAYSRIGAPRPTTIDTADDPDALLGLSGVPDPGAKPVFTNQTNSDMTVTLSTTADIQFDLDDDGTWSDPPVTFILAPGASQLMNLRGSVTTADVTIDATMTSGGVTTGTISMIRSFAIPAAGNILEVSGTFKSAGKSGKYEFDLQNVSDTDGTLVAIGVNGTTNPAAIEVSSGKILTVNNTQVMTTPIPVDSSDLTSNTRVDFDQNVSMPAQTSKTFEFDRFQKTGSPSNADMTEQDVRLTVYSSDGGSATTNICFGACDF